MTTSIRILSVVAISFLIGSCVTSQHKGDAGTIVMTSAEANGELQALSTWIKAHPGRNILVPEVTGENWTFDNNGITEKGLREKFVGRYAPPGKYWVTKERYSETMLFSRANDIKHGLGFIRLGVRKLNGAMDTSITIPTGDRPAKNLVSALLALCPNVR